MVGWTIAYTNWLVVSTALKSNSQLGLLFPIYGKTKNVPNISKPPTSIEILRGKSLNYMADFPASRV